MAIPPQLRLDRLRAYRNKLTWGLRVVGYRATIQGLFRLALLKLRRPPRARVKLASGAVMEFANPAQLVPALVMFGDLIDPEYPLLRAIAKPDWRVVDVGAAIGQFTVFAAGLPCAVVHAYEPSRSNINTLERNLEVNGAADRVVVHQRALSDADGEAEFATAGHTFLSQLDHQGTAAGPHEVVSVRTLDGELADLGLDHLELLKVNVAGFEPEVLAGARGLLSEGRADVVIMLIGLRSIANYRELAGYGYRLFFYDPYEPRLHEVRADDPDFPHAHPAPARHLIGIHQKAIDGGILDGVALRMR